MTPFRTTPLAPARLRAEPVEDAIYRDQVNRSDGAHGHRRDPRNAAFVPQRLRDRIPDMTKKGEAIASPLLSGPKAVWFAQAAAWFFRRRVAAKPTRLIPSNASTLGSGTAVIAVAVVFNVASRR